jgi:hypothetical protein
VVLLRLAGGDRTIADRMRTEERTWLAKRNARVFGPPTAGVAETSDAEVASEEESSDDDEDDVTEDALSEIKRVRKVGACEWLDAAAEAGRQIVPARIPLATEMIAKFQAWEYGQKK